MGPLVTVITGSYRRPRTLADRCLPSIDCQTFRPLEHIVVLDGPDDASQRFLRSRGYSDAGARRVVELGANWTQPFGNGCNAAICRLVGTYLARGDIIGCLDDDNLWKPDHVEQMVACFDESGADMVLSEFVHSGRVMATAPAVGHVDTSSFMYRREALVHSNWQPDGYECDGRLAERLSTAVKWTVKGGPTVEIIEQRFGRPDA